MSGPKVVRIISPEELEILRGRRDRALLQLRKQIEEWQMCLKQCQCLSADRIVQVENNFVRLQNAFSSEFEKPLQNVFDEIQRLKGEMIQVRVDFKAAQVQQRRELERTARSLCTKFESSKLKIPIDLLEIVESAKQADDVQLEEFKKRLNRISAELLSVQIRSGQESTVVGQSALAKDLAQGLDEIQKVVDSNVQKTKIDLKSSRMARLIIELELFDDLNGISEFQQRAAVIDAMDAGNQKELLIDSLVLELSKLCKERAEIHNLTFALGQSLEEAKHSDLDCYSQLQTEFASIMHAPNLPSVRAALDRSKILIANETKAKIAESKRRAILKCFGKLGYEIREGMTTAWAHEGKLVVSKSQTPEIGIEVGSAQGLDRLQFRAVAIAGQGHDGAVNGKAIEDAWCSELALIKIDLASQGHSLEIEHSKPSGTVPLKVCPPSQWLLDEQNDESIVPERKARYID